MRRAVTRRIGLRRGRRITSVATGDHRAGRGVDVPLWDVYVYNAAGTLVAPSASFGDTTEDAVLADPPPGTYTAVIVNYDQIDGQPYDDWGNGRVEFDSPRPRVETGVKEAWTLT